MCDGCAHSGHLADHVAVEIDEAKQHAESTTDKTLRSALTAVKGERAAYQGDPRKALVMAGAVAVGILALITLLRRL